MNMNLVIVQGHLGSNIKHGVSKNGSDWCSFSIGIKEEKATHWINVMCFGKSAESMKRGHNGDGFLVHGKLQTSSYEDKDGRSVQKTQIIASQVSRVGYDLDVLTAAVEPKFDEDEGIPF